MSKILNDKISNSIGKYFICTFFVLLLYSCQTSKLSIQSIRPASINIPKDIRKIVLIDRTGKAANPLAIAQKGITDKTNYIAEISFISPDFKGSAQSPLPWNAISDLLKGDTTSLLASIEEYKTGSFIDQNQQYSGTTPLDIQGRPTTTPKRYIPYFIYHWRLYELKTKSVLEDFNMDTQYHSDLTEYLIPRNVNDYREYYKCGSSKMKSASKLVKENKWDVAVKIWNQIAIDSTSKLASKAYFNLALSEEMKSNINEALELANKSKRLGNEKAAKYILILQQHQKAIEEINSMKRSN